MPLRMMKPSERAALARLFISYGKTISQTVLNSKRFGADATDAVLAAGLVVGTMERRPMTAAQLAAFCSIPRPSVVRRLKVLEKRGIVVMEDKRARLADKVAFSQTAVEKIASEYSWFLASVRQLSKLDIARLEGADNSR